MKVGIICEGTTDEPLLEALLRRIGEVRAGITWNLSVDDLTEVLPVRKTGFGGVVGRVKDLVKALGGLDPPRHDVYVILLDQRTKQARRDIRRAIQGKPRFILGVAIREIEAWWLADRVCTLEWLGLDDSDVAALGYEAGIYRPERDRDPKKTLDRLTQASDRVAAHYGDGHTGLAEEFAELWCEQANLDVIEHECSKGFAPFSRESERKLRRARDAEGLLT